jgi:selenocysteine lyase/cysteine desulfurase
MSLSAPLPHAEIRRLFAPAHGSAYLDAATYGLPPRPTVVAMQRALEEWQQGTADWMRSWDESGDVCREQFGRLIGAQPASIALVPAVSVAVGIVASSLRPGEEVVAPADEFTSVLFPLLVAERERGVSVRTVPFTELANAVGPSTRLVAFSLVQSQSGLTAPLADICAAARSHGARTLVDATHAVPFVPVDGELPRIDYLVCAAYKHLLCPRGVSFLYVAPDRWDEVVSVCAGWRGASDPYGHYYGGPLDLAPNAARFDVSLAWFSWVGASVSLGLICEWQRAGILPSVLSLAARLAAGLGLPEPRSSVVSVPVHDAEAARGALEAAGVRAAVRAGAVRFAPHVYNTPHDIDRAVEAVSAFVFRDHHPAGGALAGLAHLI